MSLGVAYTLSNSVLVATDTKPIIRGTPDLTEPRIIPWGKQIVAVRQGLVFPPIPTLDELGSVDGLCVDEIAARVETTLDTAWRCWARQLDPDLRDSPFACTSLLVAGIAEIPFCLWSVRAVDLRGNAVAFPQVVRRTPGERIIVAGIYVAELTRLCLRDALGGLTFADPGFAEAVIAGVRHTLTESADYAALFDKWGWTDRLNIGGEIKWKLIQEGNHA